MYVCKAGDISAAGTAFAVPNAGQTLTNMSTLTENAVPVFKRRVNILENMLTDPHK